MVHRRRRQRPDPGAVVGLIPRPRPGGGRVERDAPAGPAGRARCRHRATLAVPRVALARPRRRPPWLRRSRARTVAGSSRASPARRSRRRALPRRPRTDRCRSPDTIAQHVQACTPCHGREARTTHEGVFPRIGGKAARYVDTPQRIAGDERRPAADAELVRAGRCGRRADSRRWRPACAPTWGNAGVTGVAAAGGALPPATDGARRSSPRRQCSGSKESA
jgi:cytochrome c553